jgi:hypothetical protein
MRTVKPIDLVFKANTKVGIATTTSRFKKTTCPVSPLTIKRGVMIALNIAIGIKPSHSSIHRGSLLPERKNKGNSLGRYVTAHMKKISIIVWELAIPFIYQT